MSRDSSAPPPRRDGRPPKRGSSGPSRSGKGRPPSSRGPKQGQRRDGRADKPLTEAEKRSIEVKRRRAPRTPRDPELERAKIEGRSTEQWIDEGSIRDAASGATKRATDTSSKRRPPKPLDPEVQAELSDALGAQRGARLAERLAQASEALDRERFQEARRIAGAIAKEAPTSAAAQEVVGLSNYRLGNWKAAARALETAHDLHPDPAMLPVIADCHRAQRNWKSVDRVWQEIKSTSPTHEVMAEGRMVAAGALADQGDLKGALAVMEPATKRAKSVRDHHLRQWYVLGDLHDRLGDPISARRWFSMIADRDPEFSDVDSRLRGLGR